MSSQLLKKLAHEIIADSSLDLFQMNSRYKTGNNRDYVNLSSDFRKIGSQKSDENNQKFSYVQLVALRGAQRHHALSWPGSRKLISVHVPLSDPDSLAIIGIGSYFEAFLNDEALCICYGKYLPAEKEKNLKPLVEYLRLIENA